MLTAERIRDCRGSRDVLSLFAELGYPIAPVRIEAEQWRRAGVSVSWNGGGELQLAARLRRFDLFLMEGAAADEEILEFLNTYRDYNRITKSAVIKTASNSAFFSVYDLSSRRTLRRLDVDIAAPRAHSIDRLNLLAASGAPLARVFDLALDRETLTRRFFERFRDAVRDVTLQLRKAAPGDTADACSNEAVLIMSRLLFLSFVQEKGWLNGERRFLFDRLAQRDYFASVLAPLFFECLNTPAAARDGAASSLGRIPYLNGGLFEPAPFERRNPRLRLPDDLMRRVVADVFEHFDFSSDEGDAAGTHVDPEMLGRVFESLMASEERKASGSFYTPKEIVDVLTTRAVDEWVGSGTARERLARLEAITVLDPACGSGAFLLSALGAIERRTREIAGEAGLPVPATLRQSVVERSLFGVDLKAEAVRLCELRLWLAIVSSTRCEIDRVPPLPNLDRNILQGNSLLSPADFLGGGRLEIYREWVYALRAQKDLVTRYHSAGRDERPALARVLRDLDRRLASELVARAIDADESELQRVSTPERDLFGRARPLDYQRCRELQERISRGRRALERLEQGELDFFSFDVHFAHLLAEGGFAVVASNPPWVRNARIEPSARRMLAERYPSFGASGERSAFHQPDLAVAFFDRALSLVAPEGIVTMLVPSKIANASYGAALRRALARHDVIALEDWSTASRRLFDANTFPLGVTVARRSPRPAISVSDGELRFELRQDELEAGGAWALVPPEVGTILRRLRSRHGVLESTLGRRPVMGVKTGENRAFFLGDAPVKGNDVITAEGIRIPLGHVARCVRGRNVRRWRADGAEWMVWPPRDGWGSPPRWLSQLAAARGVELETFRLSFVKPEHVGLKVAWKDVAQEMSAVVLPESVAIAGHSVPLVPNQTLYSLDMVSIDEAHVLAAILNSSVAGALLLAVAERAKDAHFRFFGKTVAAVALPRVGATNAAWPVLARLSRRAHRNEEVSDEVDGTVAELYGVSRGELTVLRRWIAHRLGRARGTSD